MGIKISNISYHYYLLSTCTVEYTETCTNTALGSPTFSYDFISKSQMNESMIPGITHPLPKART